MVVIAIIGIIAAMLLPVLAKAKEKGIRTKCLSNVKQFTLGVIVYGSENNDRLPAVTGGYWAWDIPKAVCDTMMRLGYAREVLYDPGFPNQNNDELWNWTSLPYRVTGYAMTFPGTPSVSPTNQNPSLIPQPMLFATLMIPAADPSRRVLIAGSVISAPGQRDPALWATYRYTDIYGGWSKPHRSSHLDKRGKFPTGDNVGMLEGSASWRNYKIMQPRTSTTTTPVFWW